MSASSEVSLRGIVLAGVHAWGESALERVCPRPLLPLAGRPMVWYAIEWLRRAGLRRVTVCANSDSDALRSALGDGGSFGAELAYYSDSMPRGPAGCARDAALATDAGTFVIVDGTRLPSVDLDALLASHLATGADLTLGVCRRPSDGSGEVHHAEPAGVCVAARPALEQVLPTGYQDIKESWIPRLHQGGRVVLPFVSERAPSIKAASLREYLAATSHVLNELDAFGLGRDYERVRGAWIHRSARIGDGVRLVGTLIVGPGCVLNDGAAVFGPAVIAPGAVVGAGAVVTQSVVLPGAHVGAGAILVGSLVLEDGRVEPRLVMRDAICGPRPAARAAGVSGRSYWAMSHRPEPAPRPQGLPPARPVRPPAPVRPDPAAALAARAFRDAGGRRIVPTC